MSVISDEKELEKIFGMESVEGKIINNIIKENADANNKIPTPIPLSNSLRSQYAEEAIKNGFLDLETWNKIVQYEKNYTSDAAEVKSESYEEEMIRKCLLISPGSRFVHGVKVHFEKTGKVSEKQMEVLEKIYDSSRIEEV